ncbi:MAG: I78 family peptidase inhibitor [Novosphingobium sp.]
MRTAPNLTLGAAACLLCACAPLAGAGSPPPATADSCLAAPGQAFISRPASSESGAALLAATGAREIRWVPPRTAVTMEYKYGRLTVGYDDAMAIVSVGCS